MLRHRTGEGVRRRVGSWLILAVLVSGCATHRAGYQPTVNDQTDVWFAQHMVPHLLQTSAVVDLAGEQLTRPPQAGLAGRHDQPAIVMSIFGRRLLT
jgi:hypothetical protein